MTLEPARVIVRRSVKPQPTEEAPTPKTISGKKTQGQYIHGICVRDGRIRTLCCGRTLITNRAKANAERILYAVTASHGWHVFQQADLELPITCPRCLTILSQDTEAKREMTRKARAQLAASRASKSCSSVGEWVPTSPQISLGAKQRLVITIGIE